MTRAATKLAINRLLERRPLDDAAVDRFIGRHGTPIIEGSRATFLWRGHADEVSVRHRVVGLADPLWLRHVPDTDLWYVTTEIPEGSRIEYQFEVTRDDHTDSFLNDPLNPKLAHGPFGASSVCAAAGYEVPDWCLHDPEARTGELVERSIASKALRRQVPYQLYLPARFRSVIRYPLVVVHDGHGLPPVRLGQDRARQPHPPQRDRGDGGRLRAARGRPARGVRQQRPARPLRRP